MTPRLDPTEVAPDLYLAVLQLEQHVRRHVDHRLLELVKLRASMINGCAYCVDMHSSDAIAAGETAARLFGLAAWRETPFFDRRERAALALTDAVTRIDDGGVPDDVWDAAAKELEPAELAELVGAIAVINVWNRLATSFRTPPRSAVAG